MSDCPYKVGPLFADTPELAEIFLEKAPSSPGLAAPAPPSPAAG